MLKRSHPDPEWLFRIRTRLSQEPVLWIQIPWTDLGSCISSEATTDPGFWWPIIKKNTAEKIYFWPKIAISFSKGLLKGRPSYSLQPRKEHPAHPKKGIYQLFSIFICHFCPPGSGFRIRIRIQGPLWIWIPSRSGYTTLSRCSGSDWIRIHNTVCDIDNKRTGSFPCTAHSTKTQPDQVFNTHRNRCHLFTSISDKNT